MLYKYFESFQFLFSFPKGGFKISHFTHGSFLINFCWEDHHHQQNINSWQEGHLDFFLNLPHCATHSVKTWIFLFVFLDGLSMSMFIPKILLNMRIRAHIALWKKSYDKPRLHIKKQKHYFANQSPSSQSYGFSCSHIRMWELDHKESWAPENWYFWTVVLEKTLESPLDCKIQPVNPEGNQS